jgi:hypothetical protein
VAVHLCAEWKSGSVINYYSAKSHLPEKILILVSIPEVFPNSDLELGKPFSHKPLM